MKIEIRLVFFTLLLFLVLPTSLFAQQRIFYGQWTKSDYSFIETMSISANEFTVLRQRHGEKIGEAVQEIYRIHSWTEVRNLQNSSKNEYPNGYRIEVSAPRDYSFIYPLDIFISKNKRSIYFGNALQMSVFDKR